MGAYFYFMNSTTREESSVELECNYGLEWVAKFDSYSEKEQIKVFEEVIKGNGWSTSDEIVASGDNGTTLVFVWMDEKSTLKR
jgi:hypothetical protein